jgi:hypothetical protein
LPDSIYPFDAEKNSKDYLYQELRDGEKMRLSFWLDKLHSRAIFLIMPAEVFL